MFLLDVDGVVADPYRPLCKILGLDFEKWVPGEYWLEEAFGITNSEAWQHPSVRDPKFWSGAPKTPWADELVDLIVEKAGGKKNVCFLTKPTLEPSCASAKVAWLSKHYGDIHYLIGTSKKYCAGPGKTLVDDHDANVEEFTLHGGRGILFPRIWNSGHRIADPMAYLRSIL